MDAPPVQYVTSTDGISIAFTTSGHGLPLVMLPLPLNHVQLAWQTGSSENGAAAWLSALSGRFRLVTYDGRCQGLSTRGCPAEDWIEAELEDLSAVVDAVRLERFLLFGVWARAHTAVHYAIRHPERVHALILQGPLISGATGLSVHAMSLAERDWEFFLRSHVPVGTPIEYSERILSYMTAAMTQADWLPWNKSLAASDIGHVLKRVETPTLVTYDRSPYSNEADSVTVTAGIVGAKLVMLDEHSGYPDGTPSATLDALETFLRELPGPEQLTGGLSPREIEVLRLVAEGKSNRAIAEALVISERTVINHLSNIFAKTGAENRAGAAAYAFRHGLM
jgi:DNA-binding CsgD family transcriptional regulator